MATTPPAPAPPALPKLTKPKLSGFERRTLNNALEGAQEWVAANETAINRQNRSHDPRHRRQGDRVGSSQARSTQVLASA